MKKQKTKIYILSILLLISSIKIVANAGTKDSKLIKNRVEGIYAIAPLSDNTHLYYLQMYTLNNKPSYCIEIGKDITTDTYNSTENIEEQKEITKLTKEQLDYIKAIAYFGYGYQNHNDKEYYMAAQEIIWEYLENIDITWTSELDINGPKINIDTYKNEIKDLVKRYTTPLSLPKNVVYKVGTTNTITDPNNSIPFYTATSTANQVVNIEGNTLIIKIGPKRISSDTIILKRKNDYSEQAMIYNFENSQQLLSVGNLEKVEYSIYVIIKGATLTIYVIDKDTNAYKPYGQANIIGNIYEIYDEENKLISTLQVPYEGFTKINNLSLGTYYIKHKQPSKGYKLNDKITKLNIDSVDKKITLIEEVIKNTIEINKLYEFETGNTREKDIKFNIYDNNDNLYSSIITTEDGPDLITLPYGKYTIKQENTTYGYEKVEDIKINIEEDNKTTITYNLLDKKIKSKVHITTKDKINNENILESNITYKIINKKNNEYINYGSEKETEFYTNEFGELVLPIELPYGEYQLEQQTPPKHYLKNEEKLSFEINDKTEYSYINNKVMLNIDYFNTPITGKINIKVLDEKIKIENNQFYKEEIEKENEKIALYQEDNLIKEYVTNNEGKIIIDNLYLGEYCLINTTTKEKKCIELKNKDNITKTLEEKVTFKNKINTTTLTINNIDNDNNPIKGTTIVLLKENERIIEDITNQNGKINIKNIPNGRYCIEEIKISNQYYLNQTKECFEISSKEKNITIKNKLKKKTISVPNTLSNKKSIVLPIIILMVLLYIINILRKNKSNNNKYRK